ncbi:hypothetical protein RvY_17099-2 [Ramazzottius varieornatus]|uniref:Uncharacterized protein n=1 Tax=Ramazzottius varieornatus TaxID=947166 RepID=A0A1D1W719_RAMVA|nr:hypothetical protein RvY_17099-2 [Ramazzottius varieornatus]
MAAGECNWLSRRSFSSVLCWLLLQMHIGGSWAFNLDLSNAVTHQGQAGSMFGFTVLQYSDRGRLSLLVGAPEAQTNQENVVRGGAVFKCSITQAGVCEEVVFDAKGHNAAFNTMTNQLEPYDDKSNQWFGATMTSSVAEDGIVAVCAPRYVYFSPNFQKREPTGTCYVATKSLQSFAEYSPCRSSAGSSGYHQQGSCQGGFSASISRDGSRFFMGAPGTWYWQGQVHSQSLSETADLLNTVEGPPSHDDSYLGYSTAVGEFTGDRQDDIAVGMPRGYNLTGAVILFDGQLRNLLNLSGEEMGSYFGYAVSVGDINGDKLDDLVVGAPLFTNFSSNDNSIERGRVYVFYQKSSHQFSRADVMTGEFNRGRLGMSVAAVGDLNLDGYGDIAAGAPYGGEEGSGMVYIFMGGRGGVITKAAQAIAARQLGPALSTFGWSLSGGIDMDGNQYPDVVVGAYKSDQAVVLRSRPVVVVTALLDMPTTVNLEQQGNCILKNGTRVNCFVLNTFVQYTGINVPDNLAIEVETILDSGSAAPRAFFQKQEGVSRMNVTYELGKNQQRNNSQYIYIPNSFRDKLNPIKMEARYRILDETVLSRPRREAITPILDQLNSTMVSKSIRIGNKCGPDNVCYPALRLSAGESTGMKEYVLGRSEPLTIEVQVSNEGEDSFETMFYLHLPLGVDYVKMQQTGGTQNVAVTCTHRGGSRQPTTASLQGSENVVMCDIGNPFSTGQKARFTLFLAPIVSQLSLDNTLNFTATVNSSNPERLPSRNRQVLFRLPLFAEAQLSLTGASIPPAVRYCIDCKTPSKFADESQVGPEVKHVFQIYNKGPSTMETGQVRIIWPSYTRDRMPLLYLLEEPYVEGNARCQKVPVNLADVVIQRNSTMEQQKSRVIATGSTMTVQPLAGPTSSSTGQAVGAGSARRQRQASALTMADFIDDVFDQPAIDRPKRAELLTNSDTARIDWLDPQKACGASDCTIITCDIGRLMEREHVVITLRSRLWEDSLRKLQFGDLSISSRAIVQVQTLTQGIRPRSHQYASEVVSLLMVMTSR